MWESHQKNGCMIYHYNGIQITSSYRDSKTICMLFSLYSASLLSRGFQKHVCQSFRYQKTPINFVPKHAFQGLSEVTVAKSSSVWTSPSSPSTCSHIQCYRHNERLSSRKKQDGLSFKMTLAWYSKVMKCKKKGNMTSMAGMYLKQQLAVRKECSDAILQLLLPHAVVFTCLLMGFLTL